MGVSVDDRGESQGINGDWWFAPRFSYVVLVIVGFIHI